MRETDSSSTPAARPFQFGLATMLRVVTVLAVLFAFPGGMALVWSIFGPLIAVMTAFAMLLVAQFPIYLFFRRVLKPADAENAAGD